MKKQLILSFGFIFYQIILAYFFRDTSIIFLFFTITAFIFSLFLSKKELFYTFSPMLIIWIIHLLLPNTNISFVIINIIFLTLSIYSGYSLKKSSWIYKIVYITFIVLIGLYGIPSAWSYSHNKNARVLFDSPKIVLKTSDDIPFRLDTIQNKIIVLDFWTTSCGICFKKFPKYEKIVSDYKENSSVLMYTVNIPTNKDTIGAAKKMINQFNYNFMKLYASSDSIPKSLGFNKYPTLIIIKNGKVRYNGMLMLDNRVLIYNLKDEIDLLLKEL